MSVIDEVKQKSDIVEVIGRYAKVTKAGRNYRALCPFHSETRPSFFIYPEQQSWHCFGACNTGGDVFSFVMKKEGIEFGEALRTLAQEVGVVVPDRPEEETGREERNRLREINEAASLYFHNLMLNSVSGEPARAYLIKRGFTDKSVSDFGLGYSPSNWEDLKQYLTEKGFSEEELLAVGLIIASDNGKTHDRFRNRLMFPINDPRGKTIGFGGRVLDDGHPKYMNSPQSPVFDKSGNLYAIDLAASSIRKLDVAVIVEGYMDVITAHQNGFTNVVAAMGIAVTERQMDMLKKLSRNVNVVLALDADAAGEEASLRGVALENTLGAEIKVAVLPAGKDPDDVIRGDKGNWQQLIENALPVVDFTFERVIGRLDLGLAKDKSLAAERLLAVIGEIKDVVRQAHYVQKLGRLVGVDERKLETMMKSRKAEFKPGKQQKNPVAVPVTMVSPIEEYCLTLLLKHPELGSKDAIPEEYFTSSENLEIYRLWREADNPEEIQSAIDAGLQEHLDVLLKRDILDDNINIEERYQDCVLSLKREYHRRFEIIKEEALTQEVETGGTAAELAKLVELGTENVKELGKVFNQEGKRGWSQRR